MVQCRACSLLIDRLHKLAYHQWYTLDSLDFLLRSHKLALKTSLLIFNVLFLEMDVPARISHVRSGRASRLLLTLAASEAS
jgi:hypothetical protein